MNRFAVNLPMLNAVNRESRQLLQVLNGRFLCFAPISYMVPQKSSNIHAIYDPLLTMITR